jgi:hypothetical protein
MPHNKNLSQMNEPTNLNGSETVKFYLLCGKWTAESLRVNRTPLRSSMEDNAVQVGETGAGFHMG